jgi:hypothetical protein
LYRGARYALLAAGVRRPATTPPDDGGSEEAAKGDALGTPAAADATLAAGDDAEPQADAGPAEPILGGLTPTRINRP